MKYRAEKEAKWEGEIGERRKKKRESRKKKRRREKEGVRKRDNLTRSCLNNRQATDTQTMEI